MDKVPVDSNTVNDNAKSSVSMKFNGLFTPTETATDINVETDIEKARMDFNGTLLPISLKNGLQSTVTLSVLVSRVNIPQRFRWPISTRTCTFTIAHCF